jgi:hypothetical protein
LSPPEFGDIFAFQLNIPPNQPISKAMAMDDSVARLRTHLRNIDRYQNLLKTRLTELELQYLEKRLLEEHSAVAALLQSPRSSAIVPKGPGTSSPRPSIPI